MKKTLFLFLLFPLFVSSQNYSKKRSALFIGNSYTYVNNLPQLVEQMALAAGDTLIVDSYAPGGYSFNNHFNDANTKAKIYSKHWDFVILQAQSQEPSFSPAQVNAQTTPYALKLDSLIKDNYACTKTVFYETWGRKFGDASNCAAYPPICTYTGMQNRLKQSYKLFADNTGGIMAPAGEAYRASILQNPTLELYQADQSHPSIEGSYLTAAVFYETLFQKSVLSNTYISSVNSATAAFLQQVAHDVIHDSLSVWNIGINLPWANFTYTASSANSFLFESYSTNLNNHWYFGDGSTSFFATISHYYNASGTYTVSHVVKDSCTKDSLSRIITVSLPVGLQKTFFQEGAVLYPNPALDWIWFKGIEAETIEITDASGQVLKRVIFSNPLSIVDLEEGLYFLKTTSKSGSHYFHFLKSGQ